MKQADLCRMTKIPSSQISGYVNNTKSPLIGTAIQIADALHVTLDELTGRTPPKDTICPELYEAVSPLSVNEQLFLTDVAGALKQRLP